MKFLAIVLFALIAVGCDQPRLPTDTSATALQELPAPDEVAYIEVHVRARVIRIDDPEKIQAALNFLRHDLNGWYWPPKRRVSGDTVKAAFVRKSDRDPFAFFIDPGVIAVAGTRSGGEAEANSITIGRFKSILGIT